MDNATPFADRSKQKAIEWATATVSWGPARLALKKGAHAAARARGKALERRGELPEIANIYTASTPKAGSQWMRAVFDHPVVRAHTNLFTVPQLNYQDKPERGLPLASYVPGLYVRYDEYRRIPHRYPHRVVYMFRDPRDVVVSGYFSAVKTHQNTYNAYVEQVRDELRAMPFDEGLLKLIEEAAPRLQEIATWAGIEDPNVEAFKLEEVSADPEPHVRRMLAHCGVELSEADLATLLADTSRESLQAKDLAKREAGAESHYRVDRKGYRDLFQPEHYAAVEKAVPGLVAQLGYPE